MLREKEEKSHRQCQIFLELDQQMHKSQMWKGQGSPQCRWPRKESGASGVLDLAWDSGLEHRYPVLSSSL